MKVNYRESVSSVYITNDLLFLIGMTSVDSPEIPQNINKCLFLLIEETGEVFSIPNDWTINLVKGIQGNSQVRWFIGDAEFEV